MFIKKQRESLKGLSHQDKVKRLEKITKVPLQKLKTNIIESDFEEDDIDVPISLKQIIIGDGGKPLSLLQGEQIIVTNNKEKHIQYYDQQKINKSIRAMTNELYSLEKQSISKQTLQPNKKDQQQKQTLQQPNISTFTIEQIDLELEKLCKKQPVEKLIYSTRYERYESSKYYQCQNQTELADITDRTNQNEGNMNLNVMKKHHIMRRTQIPTQRQTQPLFFAEKSTYESIKTAQKLTKPQNNQKKILSSQSSVTKRFSRSKKNPDLLNCDNFMDKKLKFNRSSNFTNKLVANLTINNKQNILNFEAPKRHLLTQRLSYQQIPTYERPQTALKKKKYVGSFFDFHNEESHHEKCQIDLKKELIVLKSNLNSQTTKQRIKQQIDKFERLSQEDIFKQFQQKNIQNYLIHEKDLKLMAEVFKSYKQSIDLLKFSL